MSALSRLAEVIIDQNDINTPKADLSSGTLQIILQIIFGVLGGIAVLVIVLAGLRMVMAQGNPEAVAKARNTILYAVIGLIITLIAFSIVTFVVGKV